MRKTKIILFAIIIVSLFSGIASASTVSGTSGTMLPLQLNNFQMTTSGLVITPSWKPAYVKWYLLDPSGNVNYMVESDIDSITQVSSGFNSATWSIRENSGTMKIPAFAQAGVWTLQVKIYDINRVFIIQWSNQAVQTIATVQVSGGSILDSLNAPFCVYWKIGLVVTDWEISFATPDLGIMLLGIIIFMIFIVNITIVLKRRKTYA
jgi:hypothetical protein